MTPDAATLLAAVVTRLGKPFDYAVYAAFGALFALIPLVLRPTPSLTPNPTAGGNDQASASRVHLLVVGVALVVCLLLVGPQFAVVSVPTALIGAGIVVALSAQRDFLAYCRAFWPTLLAFHAVLQLLGRPYNADTFSSVPALLAAFVLSFAFVSLALGGRLIHLGQWLTWPAHVGLGLTVLTFARTTVPLSDLPLGFHPHWGAIIGPVELIRDGGRVLYDVPLQYGLLNTLIVLLISWVVGDAWAAFQWFFQATTALQGLLLYLVLGRLLQGLPLRWPAAAVLTVGPLFFMQGLDCCLGTYASPAIGMYRYLPVWLLIAYVVYCWDSLHDRRFYGAGCAIWLIGCAWSAEILVLTTFVWFGCVALRAVTRTSATMVSGAFLRAVLPVLLAHAVAMLAAIALASGLYAAVYGALPDLPRYFDFLLHITETGWFARRATEFAASVVPVLAAILTAFGLIRLARGGASSSVLATAYVTALGFWAATSYFASRSLPIIISYSAPYIVMALLALIRKPLDFRSAQAIMTAAFCAAVVALPIGFGGVSRVRVFEQALAPQPSAAEIVPWYAEPAGSVVSGVLAEHGESVIPLVGQGEIVPDRGWPAAAQARFPTPRYWLPLAPEVVLVPLPHWLRTLYIERWVARSTQPGWLIVDTATHGPGGEHTAGLDFLDAEELAEYLGASHVLTEDRRAGALRIMRFEPRPTRP